MDRAAVEVLVAGLTAGEADPVFRRRASWALSRLEAAPGQRILEVGSGLSSLLLLLRQVAPVWAVAVDVDVARLAGARRCGDAGPAVAADAAALPFRAQAFDAALACEVLEHLADDAGALAELRRAVRPAGRAAVTVPNARYPASWDPLARVLETVGVQPPRRGPLVGIWTGHLRLYRAGDLRRLAAASGWRVEEEVAIGRGGFPFAALLLYGVGRSLLEAGLLGRRTAAAVGRRAGAAGPLPWWHPVGFATRVLRSCDARAQNRRGGRDRSVHLAVLLRRD